MKKCETCPKEVKDFFYILLTSKRAVRQLRTEQQEELLEEISTRVRRGAGIPIRAPGVTLREDRRGKRPSYVPVDSSSSSSSDDDDEEEEEELRAVRHESLRTIAEDEQRRRGLRPFGTSSLPKSASHV